MFKDPTLNNLKNNKQKKNELSNNILLNGITAVINHWNDPINESLVIENSEKTDKIEFLIRVINNAAVGKTLLVVNSKDKRDFYQSTISSKTITDINNPDIQISKPLKCISICSTPKKNGRVDQDLLKKYISDNDVIIITNRIFQNLTKPICDYITESCNLLVFEEAPYETCSSFNSIEATFKSHSKKILKLANQKQIDNNKVILGKSIYDFNYVESANTNINVVHIPSWFNLSDENATSENITTAQVALNILEQHQKVNQSQDLKLLISLESLDKANKLYLITLKSLSGHYAVILHEQLSSEEVYQIFKDISHNVYDIIIWVDSSICQYKFYNDNVISIIDFQINSIEDLSFQIKTRVYNRNTNQDSLNSQNGLVGCSTDYKNKFIQHPDDQAFKYIDTEQFKDSTSSYFFKVYDENPQFWKLTENPNYLIKYIELDSSISNPLFNHKNDKYFIIYTRISSRPRFTTQDGFVDHRWCYFLIYWNSSKRHICVSSNTSKSKVKSVIKKVFKRKESFDQIKGSYTFSALKDDEDRNQIINTIGLNSIANSNINSVTYYGLINNSLHPSVTSNSVKRYIGVTSDIDNDRKEIRVANDNGQISHFKRCDIYEVLNNFLQDLKNLLKENNDAFSEIPTAKQSKISEFPTDIQLLSINLANWANMYSSEDYLNNTVYIGDQEIGLENLSFSLNKSKKIVAIDKNHINFICNFEGIQYQYQKILTNRGFDIKYNGALHNGKPIDKQEPKVFIENIHIELSMYFMKYNNLRFEFIGGKSIVADNLFEVPLDKHIINTNNILDNHIDWTKNKTDFSKESFDDWNSDEAKHSIQYAIIDSILANNNIDGGRKRQKSHIVYKDDGSGEIADIISIKLVNGKLTIDLFHCKYSSASKNKIGLRQKDMIEVCAQAYTSIKWLLINPQDLIKQLLKRYSSHISNFKKQDRDPHNKFFLGDVNGLKEISRKLKSLQEITIDRNIYIVQPGLSKTKLISAMNSKSSEKVKSLIVSTEVLCTNNNTKLYIICS